MRIRPSAIPFVFRLLPGVLFVVSAAAWFLAIMRPPRAYFGLEHSAFVTFALSGVLLTGGLAVAFLFFPQRFLSRVVYFLVVNGRPFLAWLTLYALLEYALRLPLFYVEKSELVFNAAVLWSLRGLMPPGLATVVLIILANLPPIENPFPLTWQTRFRAWQERLHARIDAIEARWSALLPALIPIALILLVVYGVWGVTLADYLPVFWNDATGYWLWIRQVSFYGLGGGYNYPDELMPVASFNRLGEGSPLYVYFYGLFGWLLGWRPHLPLLVNFGLLFAAVYGFARWARLETGQNLMLTLVLAVSWPVMLFAATTSHEPLNQAIGIAFAALFLRLRQEPPLSLPGALAVAAFGFLAGMVRLSWVILFPPLFYFLFRGSPARRIALSLLTSALLGLAIVQITGWLVPPVNNSIFAALQSEHGPLFGMAQQFLAQVKKLVIKQTMTPALFTLFLLALVLTFQLQQLLSFFRQRMRLQAILKSQAAFDVYNLLMLVAAGFSLYLVNGFYRVFFAPLLTSLFMQIAQREYRPAWRVAVFSLLFAPVMLTGQGDWHGARLNYTSHPPELPILQARFEQFIAYDAAAESPWCNTILIPLRFYDARLAALPPGIGISYLQGPFPQTSLRSRYVWLEEKDVRKLNPQSVERLQLLVELPEGTLYRNLDAPCSP